MENIQKGGDRMNVDEEIKKMKPGDLLVMFYRKTLTKPNTMVSIVPQPHKPDNFNEQQATKYLIKDFMKGEKKTW